MIGLLCSFWPSWPRRLDSQRFAVDFVAPAAAFHHVPQREQETAATGSGENGLQGAVARLALLFDRLAKADQVDIRSRRDQASDGCLGENIPIPRRAELLHQPPRFAVDRLECRRRNIAPE